MSFKTENTMRNPCFSLVEKIIPCLSSWLKGTSTGPMKPQLFNNIGLQEELSQGQERTLQSSQELTAPVCVCMEPVPRAGWAPRQPRGGKLAGGESHCAHICLGMLLFQTYKDTAIESLPCKWDIFLQWTAWILEQQCTIYWKQSNIDINHNVKRTFSKEKRLWGSLAANHFKMLRNFLRKWNFWLK